MSFQQHLESFVPSFQAPQSKVVRIRHGSEVGLDLAECMRLVTILQSYGVSATLSHGVSDEGDPWLAVEVPESADPILHIARVDGRYHVVAPTLGIHHSGWTLREALSRCLENEVAARVARALRTDDRTRTNAEPMSLGASRVLLAMLAISLAAIWTAKEGLAHPDPMVAVGGVDPDPVPTADAPSKPLAAPSRKPAPDTAPSNQSNTQDRSVTSAWPSQALGAVLARSATSEAHSPPAPAISSADSAPLALAIQGGAGTRPDASPTNDDAIVVAHTSSGFKIETVPTLTVRVETASGDPVAAPDSFGDALPISGEPRRFIPLASTTEPGAPAAGGASTQGEIVLVAAEELHVRPIPSAAPTRNADPAPLHQTGEQLERTKEPSPAAAAALDAPAITAAPASSPLAPLPQPTRPTPVTVDLGAAKHARDLHLAVTRLLEWLANPDAEFARQEIAAQHPTAALVARHFPETTGLRWIVVVAADRDDAPLAARLTHDIGVIGLPVSADGEGLAPGQAPALLIGLPSGDDLPALGWLAV